MTIERQYICILCFTATPTSTTTIGANGKGRTFVFVYIKLFINNCNNNSSVCMLLKAVVIF